MSDAPQPALSTPPPLRLVAAATLLGMGFLAAYAVRWYCDDIFVTLRYAEQFLAGNGFVYNAGERVEGYSHFLWLLIITLLQRLGADPVAVVMSLGVLSYLATILVFAQISAYLAPRGARLFVPFTALALIANQECAIWATGGLETFFFTLLLSLAFFVGFFTPWSTRTRIVVSSLILVLATMTRPDGALFLALGGLVILSRVFGARETARRVFADGLLYAVPVVLLVVPYLIWKIGYYGSVLPNPYYAKSAYMSYYSQGFYYLWIYFRAHPTSALFIVSLLVLIARLSRRVDRDTAVGSTEHAGAALVALIGIVVYLVGFVARVGGDFMYARFVVPVLPFAFFLIEWSAARLIRQRVVGAAMLLFLVLFIAVAETALRDRLLIAAGEDPPTIREHHGVVDERFYYSQVQTIDNQREFGEFLRPHFAGLDVTVLLRGQCCLGYFAGFETCIENSGLTDATIARRRTTSRGRIGHEKTADYAYLIRRRTHFVFNRPLYKERDYRVAYFRMPGDIALRAEMITYDAVLMSELAERFGSGIHFTAFPDYLDDYIAETLPSRSPEALAADYAEFKEFYFDYNDDPERQRAFAHALAEGND